MTRLDNVLKAYKAGVLPIKWAELEFALTITPENVDAVMAQLPPEIVEGLGRWELDQPGIVIGSNLTAAGKERMETQLAAAIPALRGWFERQRERTDSDNATSPAANEAVNR